MVTRESKVPLHKPLLISLAALMAYGAMGSGMPATAAEQRGQSAPEWTRSAVPGSATEDALVEDDAANAAAGGADMELPGIATTSTTADTTADAAARVAARNALNAFNAVQQTGFKASLSLGNGGIKILYGSQSRKYADGPENVARGFLADAHELLGLQRNLPDLKTLRVDETEEKDHVRFQQTYNNIPVMGANVIVHSEKNGRVSMVQNGYIQGLRPANSDLLAETAARGIALDELKATFNAGSVIERDSTFPYHRSGGQKAASTANTGGNAEKQILRLDGRYYYIWKLSIPTKEPFGLWVFHIDAGSGKVLYKGNEIMTLKTGKGRAYISNANYLAGKIGNVSLKNMFSKTEAPDDWGYLFGAYADIYNYAGSDPRRTDYKFLYDPVSQPNEFHATQAYYAVDSTRDWWKKNVIGKYGSHYKMDDTNPFLWSTPVLVNYTSYCNAYYTSNWLGNGVPGMVFGNEGSCASGSADLVLDWDVVRHEYTHAMMDWTGFSGQFGGPVDYYGRAMGEGNADWFGFLQHPKESRMATVAWAWSANGYLRNLDNTRMYPYDVNYPSWGTPEEHYTGEIWGGYLYDLYRVLGTGATKYVYQSFFYFDASEGFMTNYPDFYDAIWAQLYAEYDLTHKYTQSFKAWGDMASRGINAALRSPYSHASDYFYTNSPGSDNSAYLYWTIPSGKNITTRGNMLVSHDTHEYVVETKGASVKLTATVTAEKNGLTDPIIGLYTIGGAQVVAPVSSTNGKSVTLTCTGLPPGVYVIRVTGHATTSGRGYYGFKVAMK